MAKADSGQLLRFRGSPRAIEALIPVGIHEAAQRRLAVDLEVEAERKPSIAVHPIPVGTSATRLRLVLPESTPPGTYKGTVHVGDSRYPIEAQVEAYPHLRLSPPRLSLEAAAGSEVEVDLTLVNGGNVACEVGRAYALGLFDKDGLNRGTAAAFQDGGARGPERFSRLMDEFAEGYGGIVRMKVEEGAGPLRARPASKPEAETENAGSPEGGTKLFWNMELPQPRVPGDGAIEGWGSRGGPMSQAGSERSILDTRPILDLMQSFGNEMIRSLNTLLDQGSKMSGDLLDSMSRSQLPGSLSEMLQSGMQTLQGAASTSGGCGCRTSHSHSRTCGCRIPPPCWAPQPAGEVVSHVCPGGTATLRLCVANCGAAGREVIIKAEHSEGITITPPELRLGPMERKCVTVSASMPADASSCEEREVILWVLGCQDHYLRWSIKTARRGADCCHEVEIEDCPDLIHHWYDHFYCERPCMR